MILFTHRNDPGLLQVRDEQLHQYKNENRMHKGFNNLEEGIKQQKKVRKHDILIVVPIVPPYRLSVEERFGALFLVQLDNFGGS